MKKNILSVMATCCFLALVAAANVHAQVPGTVLRATIPFEFSVRGKTLPAGVYEIKRVTNEPGTLIISSVNDNHERAMFETERIEERTIMSRSELVFNRYDDNYFLSEVFAGGEQTGSEAIPSRQERTLKRELARNGVKAEPETVTLAAY